MARASIAALMWEARNFLAWQIDHGNDDLAGLSVTDIDRYMDLRAPKLTRCSLKSVAERLRSLLRYLYITGRVTTDLSGHVLAPTLYAYEGLPSTLNRGQIIAVLQSAEKDQSSAGLRDYAILQLLAAYGLRSGEICEAATRPTMRFVPVKSEETQGAATVFRIRELLIRQRTQAINSLRGHLGEFGQIVPQGVANATRLIAIVEDPDSGLPRDALATLQVLVATLTHLEVEIGKLDAEIARRAKENEVARRLMTVPGIGPLIATALAVQAPAPETFQRGRDFAAWLGLTPRQHSTGGKQRLGATTKMGERSLRRLLIRMFSDGDRAMRWTSATNAALDGKSALHLMMTDGIAGMQRVQAYLDAELAG